MALKGSKLKFTEGERVLCYEPDPTKAKVLYDSKVLDVVINKDSKGKKSIEYLIHFQGWNSSWDRCVQEEFVLKDSPENRQLQRDLADQSQLQLGAYLYRKERKKHSRKVCDPRNTDNIPLSEDGSSEDPVLINDTEESASFASSSEAESIVDDEIVPIELNDYLKSVLEHDHHLIVDKNKLMRLPAEPNVITILENYWKLYSLNLLSEVSEKPSQRLSKAALKSKPEDLQRNLNICKEILDGLRIYFDFTLTNLLLYKQEKEQIEVQCAKSMPFCSTIKHEVGNKARRVDVEYGHLTNNMFGIRQNNNHVAQLTRRRSLRSNKTANAQNTNGISQDETKDKCITETPYMNNIPTSETPLNNISKILSWRLLPNYVHNQQPLPPSLIYGATHLLRLFVKLPELLTASGIMENKLKVLQHQLEAFLNYLTEQKEWYGDQFYTDHII